MTRPAARRVVAVAALVLAAWPAAALAVPQAPGGPVPVAPVPGEPTPTPVVTATTPGLPLQISLTRLDPAVPLPGGTIVLAGSVRNTSARTLTDVHVRLVVGAALTTRYDLAAFLATASPFGELVGGARANTAPSTLRPGAVGGFTLRTPVASLLLGSAGVYRFGLEARDDEDGADGRLHTLLPWAPAPAICPIRLAWVWPLVDRPHRGAGSAFIDDALAAQLTPTGRLGTLVAAAAGAERVPAPPPRPKKRGRKVGLTPRPVPVTWAVDPMLLDDAAAMAAGYRVQPIGATAAHPGTGQAAARRWLARVRAATRGADVLALPYADTDVVAAVRARLDPGPALTVGRDVDQRVLGVNADGVYWPPGGVVDEETATALFGSSVTGLLLTAEALPLPQDIGYTPTARADLDLPEGTLTSVLFDPTLSRTVALGAQYPAASRLALQRFLGETLLVAEERPCSARDLVLAPGRRWDPPAGYARQLLAATSVAPWLSPTTVASVEADPAPDLIRDPLQYPGDARAAELPGGYLSRVRELHAQLTGFESILTVARTPVTRALELGVLRAESASWRDDLGAALDLRDDISGTLAGALASVRIVSRGLYTLSSRSGTIPITIANQNSQPVHVVLVLDAGARARIAGGGRLDKVLPANRNVQVEVRAQAQTAGVFPLAVALYTPETPPRQLSQTVRLYVRSTAYGAVALGITGGAFAVLVVAVLVRLTRRALRAHRGRGRPAGAA